MIDYTLLDGRTLKVACLVERSGAAGVRVCELLREIGGDDRHTKRALAELLKMGFIYKLVGDVTRYVSELPSVVSTPPSVASTPPTVASTPPSVVSTPPTVTYPTDSSLSASIAALTDTVAALTATVQVLATMPPSVVSTPPSVVSTPPTVVSTPPSVVSTPPSVVSTPPSVASTPPKSPIFSAKKPPQLINYNNYYKLTNNKGDFDGVFSPSVGAGSPPPPADLSLSVAEPPAPSPPTAPQPPPESRSVPRPARKPPKARKGRESLGDAVAGILENTLPPPTVAPEPAPLTGTTKDLPKYDRVNGTIYSTHLERSTYLGRMLQSFDDIDFEVSREELARVGMSSSLLSTKPPEFFAYCVGLSQRELYKTLDGYKISDPLTREIFEELNHRLAYAIARRAPLFATRDLIRLFFDGMPKEVSRKKRTNYVLYALRDVFVEAGWGWEPHLFKTAETFQFEQSRAARLGSEPRNEFFPVATRLIRLQRQKEEQERQSAMRAGPDEPRSVSPTHLQIIETKNAEFKAARLGEIPSVIKTTVLYRIRDPVTLSNFLETCLKISTEISKLSAVKGSERGTELFRSGWRQQQNFWYPAHELESLCEPEPALK